MEKRKKPSRFLKNRIWRSKIANRLKGRVEDVCREYNNGVIDREWLPRVKNNSQRWTKNAFT